jgi:hypothetical protein
MAQRKSKAQITVESNAQGGVSEPTSMLDTKATSYVVLVE